MWKSGDPVDIAVVFWKLEELLVITRSVQLGLLKLLLQVVSLTVFFAFVSKTNCDRQGSDSSALKFHKIYHISFIKFAYISRPFLTWWKKYSSDWLSGWYEPKSKHFFFLRFNSAKICSISCGNLWSANSLLGMSSRILIRTPPPFLFLSKRYGSL